MHSITIENFRCFGERQTARLAPLTLLVGENSTGKTSFLALLRVLDDLAHNDIPDFKRPPYDLGSFDEIAHYRGGRTGRAETFSVEIATLATMPREQYEWKLAVRFARDPKGTIPMPVYECVSLGGKVKNKDTWMAVDFESLFIKVGTKRGTWDVSDTYHFRESMLWRSVMPSPCWILVVLDAAENHSSILNKCKPEEGSPDMTLEDIQDLRPLQDETFEREVFPRVFASAPVRSQPRRTYNPARPDSDPEGHYVPMLLAELSLQQPEVWTRLKQHLESFGRSSGLFDEIRIRHLGSFPSDPFQVQVRKFGKKIKGPWRNLMDVGYGVSQALPIITELLREDTFQQTHIPYHQRQFLLQQPEVHLHPSAQAALGSLFCQVAGPQRQLIVETHSDHLMDRVRMDVRDGVSGLKPKDVSILFFERDGLDVRIHSLRLDEQGNVLGAPNGYRQFFMDEMTRSLWPERSSERSKLEA
ncbi:MAG: hypothetical protein TH68_02410 [Candidatus Synechococcus spongiarum 142]|uniref:AAA domain-containing protein n=1 Tax=Candidatus Synechococcus spongiarum 142 TaxID=1608213 RepID=A0A6N3X669_9SYNE|nr:MAG: hypothetical protein TH68_02410 [Candidatus Synechococcus spongiarum 142]